MIFLDGFLTGLILQIAIGPVFFYILGLGWGRSTLDAYAGVLGAVLVDYLYIALAVLGIGQALEKPGIKKVLGILGPLVLGFFGLAMILGNTVAMELPHAEATSSPLSSFFSTILLTASSPLTIVFWTSLFASKAVEKGYTQKQLIPFGIAAGLATLAFLGLSVSFLVKYSFVFPDHVIRYLNLGVGGILICYGVVRFLKSIE